MKAERNAARGKLAVLRADHEVSVGFRALGNPGRVGGWGSTPLRLGSDVTHFGCVLKGTPYLQNESGTFELRRGMYFCQPGSAVVHGGSGVVVSCSGYRGLFSLGGPVERTGRLALSDGCSDSVLVAPVLPGAPRLSLLHVPQHVRQSLQVRASLCIGVVLEGCGLLQTPRDARPLGNGQLFLLPPRLPHALLTGARPMRLFVFQSDSEVAPVHASQTPRESASQASSALASGSQLSVKAPHEPLEGTV